MLLKYPEITFLYLSFPFFYFLPVSCTLFRWEDTFVPSAGCDIRFFFSWYAMLCYPTVFD